VGPLINQAAMLLRYVFLYIAADEIQTPENGRAVMEGFSGEGWMASCVVNQA
jgi:hypothetical protein